MRPQLLAAAAGAALLFAAGPSASSRTPTVDPAAALYDPAQLAAALCAPRPDRGAPMRDRLVLASLLPMAASGPGEIRLMEGLGPTRLQISTASPEAQRWFDQGLMLAFGFNHDGAIRSFREAQRLDPDCAMCFWGEAWARGPNINAPMDGGQTADAVVAARRAAALAGRATPAEQALIEAVARRYSLAEDADRAALDRAYAEAMKAAAARFPADDQILVVAAEAVMNTQPWDYWQADGLTPKGDAAWAVQAVEQVLKRSPDHPQAQHLYIHLLEASDAPQRAEAVADAMNRSVPAGVGHLVHMPSHIYDRLGRFKDSYRANLVAAQADAAFIAANPASPMYRYGYYPHNVHFLVTGAAMAGDRDAALQQAARLQKTLDVDMATRTPWVQAIWAAPSFSHAQFSSPEVILAQPAPDGRLPYAVGMWRYARAVAEAQRGDPAGVERELAALRGLRENTDFGDLEAGGLPARTLLRLAEEAAYGRLAYARGDYGEAVRRYRVADALERQVSYQEPAYWYYPVAQSLAAALLKSGQAEEARRVLQASLARRPNNGWALYALAETQAALGDKAGEQAARQALERAWAGDRKWLTLDRL